MKWVMPDTYKLYPLHIFRLVTRGGSVTRTSQELSISQPAVSARLKAPETAIGEPLFERMPRRKSALRRLNSQYQ
jgi:DNA-binding transcriptional LysR family regulator